MMPVDKLRRNSRIDQERQHGALEGLVPEAVDRLRMYVDWSNVRPTETPGGTPMSFGMSSTASTTDGVRGRLLVHPQVDGPLAVDADTTLDCASCESDT